MLIAQAPATTTISATPAPIVREVPCPAITQMLKYGAENPLTEVSYLQRILRDIEGANIFIDGDYNEETRDAVLAFQKKYSSEILGPWGATAQPTGTVSLTTAKKLNQLACGGQLTMNEREMKFISVISGKIAAGQPTEYVPPMPAQGYTFSAGDGTAESGTVEPPAYYPYRNDMMTASVANSTIAHRFGVYLRNLFK